MLGPLGEAEAGIQDDHGRVHAGLGHHLDPPAQFLAHLGHHIPVDRPGIHAVAVAPPVHHDVRHTGRRDEPGHLGIGQAPAHVVDQPGPRFQGPLGYLGPHRVHAHRDARGGQARDDRPDPAQFLVRGDALRARAGGFPAHVHDVGALGPEFQAMADPGLRAEPLTTVREGVGGDVHDAHDQAPSRVREPRRAGCPGRVNDHGVTLRGSPLGRPARPRAPAPSSCTRSTFPAHGAPEPGKSPRIAHPSAGRVARTGRWRDGERGETGSAGRAGRV